MAENPYAFGFFADRKILVLVAVCIVAVFAGEYIESQPLSVAGEAGLVGALVLQAYMNYRRGKSLFKYTPDHSPHE
jgi:hypothetical protein